MSPTGTLEVTAFLTARQPIYILATPPWPTQLAVPACVMGSVPFHAPNSPWIRLVEHTRTKGISLTRMAACATFKGWTSLGVRPLV